MNMMTTNNVKGHLLALFDAETQSGIKGAPPFEVAGMKIVKAIISHSPGFRPPLQEQMDSHITLSRYTPCLGSRCLPTHHPTLARQPAIPTTITRETHLTKSLLDFTASRRNPFRKVKIVRVERGVRSCASIIGC